MVVIRKGRYIERGNIPCVSIVILGGTGPVRKLGVSVQVTPEHAGYALAHDHRVALGKERPFRRVGNGGRGENSKHTRIRHRRFNRSSSPVLGLEDEALRKLQAFGSPGQHDFTLEWEARVSQGVEESDGESDFVVRPCRTREGQHESARLGGHDVDRGWIGDE
jgi:hypothetical protein